LAYQDNTRKKILEKTLEIFLLKKNNLYNKYPAEKPGIILFK